MVNMKNVIKIKTLKSGRLKYKEKIATFMTRPNPTYSPPNMEVNRKREEKLFSNEKNSTAEKHSKVGLNDQEAAIGAGSAPETVRKIFEENTACDLLSSGCILVHEENSPQVYFKIPDMHKTRNISVLQCADISAADLSVSSKFGSWDTMVSRILIECDGPMLLWTKASDCNTLEKSIEEVQEEKPHETKTLYKYIIMNSRMVQATFAVEDVAKARDMLHCVKVAKTKEIAKIKELKKQGLIATSTKNPSKIREGLPDWVNYIPYRWYSAYTRRLIQYVLMLYTLVSLMWALWQLYHHVDFIRAYLKPLVKFIEIYLSILKAWFQWIDNVFTVLSRYWWNYFKPLFMLIVAAFSPLFQIFKPLKGIVNIIPYIFDPFVKFINMLLLFIKPLFLPLKLAFHFIFQHVFLIIFKLLSFATKNPTIANVVQKCNQLYVVRLIQEALHGHLDPLKAQVIVIRDLIFKSARRIYYGLRFIITRFYFMIIFVKREREYSKEGEIHQSQSMEHDNNFPNKEKED